MLTIYIISFVPQVFRGENSNSLDSIALGQFVLALENTGLRRYESSVTKPLKQHIFKKKFY